MDWFPPDAYHMRYLNGVIDSADRQVHVEGGATASPDAYTYALITLRSSPIYGEDGNLIPPPEWHINTPKSSLHYLPITETVKIRASRLILHYSLSYWAVKFISWEFNDARAEPVWLTLKEILLHIWRAIRLYFIIKSRYYIKLIVDLILGWSIVLPRMSHAFTQTLYSEKWVPIKIREVKKNSSVIILLLAITAAKTVFYSTLKTKYMVQNGYYLGVWCLQFSAPHLYYY